MTKVWVINHYALPPSLGGLNRHYYFKKYSETLDVKIFTASQIHNSDINMIPGKEFMKAVEVDGCTYHYIKTAAYKGNGFSRIKNILEFAWKIKKIPKHIKERPDVIYTSSPDIFTAHYALKLAKKLRVACVVEIRDLWPESIVAYTGRSKKHPLIRILYRLEKSIYRRADKIVFTMDGGVNYIKEKGWDKSIDLGKCVHINNGVDLTEVRQRAEQDDYACAELDDPKRYKVVYVGSIRAVNDVHIIAECAKILSESHPDIQFVIFGEGNKKEEIMDYCERNKLSNIVFKGFVDKRFVPSILSKSNLNLITVHQTNITRKYGTSFNKLFDYLAAGKPVLSNVQSSDDLIQNNHCGMVTEDQSAEKMAEAILTIQDLPHAEVEELCKNAALLAAEYDYKILAQKWSDVIESVKSNGG